MVIRIPNAYYLLGILYCMDNHHDSVQNTPSRIVELNQKLAVELNQLDGENVVQILMKHLDPEQLYGMLNDRDHLIDVALERTGRITQVEGDRRYDERNPESFEEFKKNLEMKTK